VIVGLSGWSKVRVWVRAGISPFGSQRHSSTFSETSRIRIRSQGTATIILDRRLRALERASGARAPSGSILMFKVVYRSF
jgi:hypothetical protein